MSKYEDDLARELSVTQWEFLIDHYEGPRPILARSDVWNDPRTRVSLLTRDMIRLEPPPVVTARPTHTVLTEKGHAVMCAALGLMADMLHAKIASDERVAINDWFTLAPEHRTKERLVEMVTTKPVERKYAYGRIADPVDG